MTGFGRLREFDVIPESRWWTISLDGSTAAFEHLLPEAALGQEMPSIKWVQKGTPYVDNGYGTQTPVKLYASLIVTGRRYFGMLPIQEMRGLRDEHTGAVVTNAFKTTVLSPDEVERQWKKLKDGEALPRQVAIQIMGLDCWEIEGQRLR